MSNLQMNMFLSSLLTSKSSKLKRARQFAQDYQNRKLLKCVFERIVTNQQISKNHTDELRTAISKKSKIDENEIFVDSSVTPSIPLAPSKNESTSIILITNENGKHQQKKRCQFQKFPVVSAISGFMNILRIYTHQKNRKKVEIAAKSLIGDIK